MKIPKQLKIQGHIFKVRLVKSEELGEDAGETSLETNTIRICKNMPQDQIEEALFHEIFHALNFETKEETVEFLAQGLYQILSDNKMLK